MFTSIYLFTTNRCNLDCKYCVSGDSLLLDKNFDSIKISDVKEGDKIIAFDENIKLGKHRKIRLSMVKKVFKRKSSYFNVTLDNGNSIKITGDHLLLGLRGNSIFSWRKIKSLHIGEYIKTFTRKKYTNLLGKNLLINSKIINIKYFDKEIDVYNIETEHSTYIVNGFAVHNCYESNRTGDMSEETMKQSIDWLISQHDERIRSKPDQEVALTFFGGEPLLNFPVVKYGIDYAYKKYKEDGLKVGLYILSNGTILTREMEDYFQEVLRRKGLSFFIQVSLDGCRESHDKNRIFANSDKGSFDKIIENTSRLSKIMPNLIIRQTVVPENVHNLSRDFSSSINIGAKICNLTPIVEGDWSDKNIDIYLKELEKCVYMFAEHPNSKNMNFNMVHSVLSRMEDKQFNAYKGCRAGVRLAAVTIGGDIYPCHRFAAYKDQFDYKIGNVKTGIDFESDNFKKLMDMHNAPSRCNNCVAVSCNRCYATNLSMSRDPKASPDNGYCEMNWRSDSLLRSLMWKLLLERKINMKEGSMVKSDDGRIAINIGEGTEIHEDLQDVMARCIVKLTREMQIIKAKMSHIEKHLGIECDCFPKKNGKM